MKSHFRAGAAMLAGLLAASVLSTSVLAGGTITGAGATFPAPIYLKWAAAYKEKTGISLNYASIGSGGGIAQIKANTVTFGASDMPLKAADQDAAGLVMFPTVVGAEVIVYNVPGIASGALTIDGPTLANIYLGKITKWNDPAIKTLNPSVALPNLGIIVAHRSDGSGTTFVFANYLSKVSKDWNDRVGAATAVDWPVGIGGKGNEGVAGTVKQVIGSLGYVEYAFAQQNNLSWMKMINHDGKVVSPNMASFQAAASHADWAHADHMYMILTDQAGPETWPIENPTFILMHKQASDPAASAEALKFFNWAYANGDDMAKSLLYIPLPDDVKQTIRQLWVSQIHDSSGKPVFTP
jgi:phosphate transport system substrate-binding protein